MSANCTSLFSLFCAQDKNSHRRLQPNKVSGKYLPAKILIKIYLVDLTCTSHLEKIFHTQMTELEIERMLKKSIIRRTVRNANTDIKNYIIKTSSLKREIKLFLKFEYHLQD